MYTKIFLGLLFLFSFTHCLKIEYSPLDTSQPGITGIIALLSPILSELGIGTSNSKQNPESPNPENPNTASPVTSNSNSTNPTSNSEIIITESNGSTIVSESGTSDSYTLVLSNEPTANVIITVQANTQVRVNNSASVNLTFTTTNWNIPQTIFVSAVDDMIAEGNHNGLITHTSTSSDPSFQSIPISSVSVSTTDNDSAGVNIVESSGTTSVTEGGATDSYTVVLTSEPTSDVTISVAASGGLRVNGTTSLNLVFTPLNWNVLQAVTVSAVDDLAAEGNHNGVITHVSTSLDSNYDNTLALSSINVSITDSAGVIITQSGGTTTVTEGGATDSYTVVLTSPPLANVTIAVTADAQVRVNTLASVNLTFTPTNWSTAQTVNVNAVNDLIAEGNHTGTITHVSTSTDTKYNTLTLSSINVSITDNDSAGVSVVQSGGSTTVTEGATTDNYTVVLTSMPTATVTINLTADTQVRVNGGATTSLVFSNTNWNVAQSVTVSAVDDATREGTHTGTITHGVTSADTNYNSLIVNNISVNITDNDFLLSTTPVANATNVLPCSGNPCRGNIVLLFDQSMNTTITPTLVTEFADSPTTFLPISSANSQFVWSTTSFSNDTLTIFPSWYWFPENTRIRYTLSNFQNQAGVATTTDIQRIFTTTVRNQAFPLADHGNTSCYNSTGTVIACANTGSWPGQDGFYNNIPLAPSYTGPTAHATYTADRTTLDNVTGLRWRTCQVGKTGATCATGTASTLTWEDAILACQALNTQNSGNGFWGLTNWRLATLKELETITQALSVDWGSFPAATPFPGHIGPLASFHWTFSGAFNDPTQAWRSAMANNHNQGEGPKTNLHYVRCVSSPTNPTLTNFTDLSNGTVRENTTNLVWQKCAIGQTYDGTTCTGTHSTMDWSASLQACNSLTLAGRTWRVPSLRELRTLRNYGRNSPTIDIGFFPNTPNASFPSSSSWSFGLNMMNRLVMSDGGVNAIQKIELNAVRCVSTGP
jgi:hypothetical protein